MATFVPMRSPIPASRIASLLALSLLVSCGDERPVARTPELLAAGSEPRESIAFDPRPIPTSSFDLAIEMSTGVLRDGQSSEERRVAPIHLALTLRSDPTDADRGDIAEFLVGETTLTEEGADPQVLENWTKDLKRMTPRGMKGRIEADSRGRITNVDLKMPKAAPNTVRQLLEGTRSVFELFCVPRCDDRVGVGARLRDRRSVSLSGMNVDLDASYVLTARDGDRLEFETEMSIRALPQLIDLPSAKDRESKAEVLAASGQGRGRIVVGRDRIGPIEGSLSLPIEMEIRLLYEGKESTMKSAIDLRLTLTSK